MADSIKASIPGFVPFKKLSEAVAFVRTQMGDQGETVIYNVAEALMDWPQPTPRHLWMAGENGDG